MMRAPYAAYAGIYDRTGQNRFGAALARVTLAWLQERGEAPAAALDIATGTGAAALELARSGLTVAGLDASPEMIEQATRQAELARLAIEWQVDDMRAFSIREPVDLVTCFFDSLNYLLAETELLDCFAAVRRGLNQGGWFVFDLNTIHRYATDWNGASEVAYADDDTLCLFRSSFDAGTGLSPLLLTAFERVDPERDCWLRWDETHVERGYRLDLIESLLRQSGLEPVAAYQLNERSMSLDGSATEQSPRAVFFARNQLDDDGDRP